MPVCLSVCPSTHSPYLVLVGPTALQHALLCLSVPPPPSPYLVLVGLSSLCMPVSVCLSVCPSGPHPLVSSLLACLPYNTPVSVCVSVCLSPRPLISSLASLPSCLPVSVCLSVRPPPSPYLILVGLTVLRLCLSVPSLPIPLSCSLPVCPPACPFLSVCPSARPPPLCLVLAGLLPYRYLSLSVCLSLRPLPHVSSLLVCLPSCPSVPPPTSACLVPA